MRRQGSPLSTVPEELEEEEDEEDEEEDDLTKRTICIDVKYEEFCCECEVTAWLACDCGKYFRIRLMNDIRFSVSKINECKIARSQHEDTMRNTVHEDLIATVMHPCRIQAQMEQFDDIESYFEMMGC